MSTCCGSEYTPEQSWCCLGWRRAAFRTFSVVLLRRPLGRMISWGVRAAKWPRKPVRMSSSSLQAPPPAWLLSCTVVAAQPWDQELVTGCLHCMTGWLLGNRAGNRLAHCRQADCMTGWQHCMKAAESRSRGRASVSYFIRINFLTLVSGVQTACFSDNAPSWHAALCYAIFVGNTTTCMCPINIYSWLFICTAKPSTIVLVPGFAMHCEVQWQKGKLTIVQ